MNLLPATVAGAGPDGLRVALAGGGEVAVPVDGAGAGSTVTLGIRPEALRPDPAGAITGTVSHVERLGGLTLVHVTLGGGGLAIMQIEGTDPSRAGDTIRLAANGAACHVFDAGGQALAHRARHPLAA